MTNRSPDGALTAIDRAREAKGIASRRRLEQYDTQNSRLEVVARGFASLSFGGVVVQQRLPGSK